MRLISNFIRVLMVVLALLASGACVKTVVYAHVSEVAVEMSLQYAPDAADVVAQSLAQQSGKVEVRYMARIYPVIGGKRAEEPEQVLTQVGPMARGYQCRFETELEPGEYEVVAWSDILVDGKPVYNTDNFGEITLEGDHSGNNVYRESFCGVSSMEVQSAQGITLAYDLPMERPLARFELVSEDLAEFISNRSKTGEPVRLEDYMVAVSYVGFVPDAFSVYTGRPVDSTTGVTFLSSLKMLNETEASLGFDYVFISENESAVTVRVEVFDAEGKALAQSSSVKVPLKREVETVVRKNFLTQKSGGGISFNTSFGGDHTMVFK